MESAATPTRPPHPNSTAASPSPSPSSLRLWRPAAQRNLRNQWARLVKAKDYWLAAANKGLSHASALANAHLSLRSMPGTDLGALKDMPGIRDKATTKLARREDPYRNMLLSSYTEMNLAQELVDMFVSELMLKRLLLLELLWITLKDVGEYQASLDWKNELYDGESNEFQSIGLQSRETCRLPKNWREDNSGIRPRGDAPSHEVLQVYLVTWRANVNIKKSRLDEIFELAVTVEGMSVKLS